MYKQVLAAVEDAQIKKHYNFILASLDFAQTDRAGQNRQEESRGVDIASKVGRVFLIAVTLDRFEWQTD